MEQKAEEFRKYIESEVLDIIQKLNESEEVDPARIQAIAGLTLELIKPGMTLEQLYQNAIKLDDQYSELAPLVVKIMRQYEDKYEKRALEQVSALVKSGQYVKAQNMVKKVLQFKIAN